MTTIFIEVGKVVVLCNINRTIQVFEYPSGGNSTKAIDLGNLGAWTAVAVSK